MDKTPKITLTGTVEIKAAQSDTKPARIEILAYGGGPIRVPGYDRFIVIDLSGLELPVSVPLLADHENAIASLVGEGKPSSDGKSLTVTGVVSRATDAGLQVIELAREGISLQASVGVTPEKTEYISKGTVNINGRSIEVPPSGLTIVRKGILKEVSLTPAGADSNTRVNIAAKLGEKRMDKRTDAEIRAAERSRLDTIGQLCDGVKGDNVATLKGSAVAEEITIEELKTGLLEVVKATAALNDVRSRPDAPAIHARGGKPVADADVLAAAFVLHCGQRNAAQRQFSEDVLAKADSLHVKHIGDLCAADLRSRGERVPVTTRGVIEAGFSSGSMAVTLASGAEKIALDSYTLTPQSWRGFAKIVPVSNFREAHALRPSFTESNLVEVSSSGEIQHVVIGELDINFQAKTYGKMVTLTRQALINDDVGLLGDTAAIMGRSGARQVSDEIYRVILANDGSHYAGGNIVIQALSADGLAIAIAAMRNMRDADNNDLDIVPTVLLVPPALETVAAALLSDEGLARYVADGTDRQPEGNPFTGKLALAVESRLSNTAKYTNASAADWYVCSSPQNAGLVVGFLDGRETPRVETQDANFNTLGQSWRVYIDFGATLGDPKASVKSQPA